MIHDAARSATKEKFVRLVSKLGKDSVSKKERDYEQTPLHVACDAGRIEIVQLLIEKYKVEVNPVDKNGWTPLHHAAASAQLPICEFLLSRGASARALSNEGASPLHYLVRHSPTDPAIFGRVLQLMLLNRADVNQQNKHGETPLHQAAHRGRDAVVAQLLSAGALTNLATRHGETPLHFAVRAGQKAVVASLLAAGADAAAVSTSGTPLELAKPYPEITEMLRRKLGQSDSRTRPDSDGKLHEPQSPKNSGGAHMLLSESGTPLPPLIPAPGSTSSFSSLISEDEQPGASVDIIDLSNLICPACTKTACEDPTRGAIHFHAKAPHQYLVLSSEDQRSRGRLSQDLCVIDGEQHFIRGLIEVKSTDKPASEVVIVFGVWAKVPKNVFEGIVASWSKAGREKEATAKCNAELATALPGYPESLSLKVQLQVREKGKRPLIDVQPSDNALSTEQRQGMSQKRLRELCTALMRRE